MSRGGSVHFVSLMMQENMQSFLERRTVKERRYDKPIEFLKPSPISQIRELAPKVVKKNGCQSALCKHHKGCLCRCLECQRVCRK